ncbi:MAG: hypothetical protein DWQ45_05440 [Planctomycetota bacterium]|nr:MAG: hypothetical protein DWQ29_21595 [Planctomycetota bacterium]REK20733.1 MAG: hypothetical protein DWQ41_24110 [Planctomycetota bacterium]REK38084.1 MAG: hypothetical protein DWQ45_05440 [Planctomycetota bacterium]
MGTGSDWRAMFENWPADMPRRAIVSTATQDGIALTDFRIAGNLLMMERDRPDSLGSRKVVVAFEAITSVRFTDTGELSRFSAMGFESPP